MAIGVVNNESSVALKVESTEGTYSSPSAGTEYIEALAEGTSANKTREELARNTLGSSTEQEASRVGIAEVVAEIPVEFGASATAGSSPQRLDLLLRTTLGGKRSAAAQSTTTGNTSTVLEFGGAPNFSKGDVVLVKEAGAFELRPVALVGATSITLAFALENGAPSDGVEVEANTVYFSDTSNSPSLSMEHNIGSQAIKQKASGLRGQSFSLENFSAGQIPTCNFSLGGLSLERADEDASAAPDFTADALPPVALEACLYIGGVKYSYSELSMSIENTLSFLIDACNESGKVSSRITDQVTTFSAKKYMDDTSLTEWDAFNDNDDKSVFFYAYNPSSTAGEFSECVAVHLPQCKVIASPVGDQDGIATDDLELKAHRSAGNDSVFISFI
jgi:hypothetical protein